MRMSSKPRRPIAARPRGSGYRCASVRHWPSERGGTSRASIGRRAARGALGAPIGAACYGKGTNDRDRCNVVLGGSIGRCRRGVSDDAAFVARSRRSPRSGDVERTRPASWRWSTRHGEVLRIVSVERARSRDFVLMAFGGGRCTLALADDLGMRGSSCRYPACSARSDYSRRRARDVFAFVVAPSMRRRSQRAQRRDG